MSEWGVCQGCGCTSKEPYCQNCDGDLEGKCGECGKAFEEDVDVCLDHIEEYRDLEKYARGLVVCRDKQIEEIRSLNAKIDGGVEYVKELNSEIARWKEGFDFMVDHCNQIIRESK